MPGTAATATPRKTAADARPRGVDAELLDERTRLMSWRIDQYHRLIETGIIEEGQPYELLDGQVVGKDRGGVGEEPMTVGDSHAWVVQTLAELNLSLLEQGCHLRVQQPVTLPLFDEPEPDGAIVRGDKNAYRHQKPGAADICCVIEVAEASLRRDRTTKRAIYARAGVSCYVIVNLIDRQIELHTWPLAHEGRYASRRVISGADPVPLPTAGSALKVPADQLLP